MNLLETHQLEVSILNQTICKNLQITIHPGDRWGILGPNGSGKTTLLNALAGLHPAKSGDILLQGRSLKRLSSKHIAQHIGVLFQETAFDFPQTSYEFCESGCHPHANSAHENRQIIQQALTDMGLGPLSSRRIQTLSGGEKRRLAIATVLAQQPQIYLLDEPLNHLDIKHQMRVIQHFKQLSETDSIGIMMAIHDLNIAQHFCNKILMLFSDGKTLHGETREVMSEKNLCDLFNHSITSNAGIWQPFFN